MDATPAPRREVSVAVAWRSDGGCHVELDSAGCMDPLDALGHIVDMVARAGRRTPVMVSGGAGALLGPLTAQKVKAHAVTEPEMARAVGGFVDDVEAARLTHDGHSQLAAAVAAARKRSVGPTGAFGWDYRADGRVLLVSATLARYGAVTARRSGGAMFV